MLPVLAVARAQVPDAGERAGRNRRRQRTGEDEARRDAPHKIIQCGTAGNIAPHYAETIGKRALDDGPAMAEPLAFGNSAAARAIEPNGMDLIKVGHGAVRVRQIAEFRERQPTAPSTSWSVDLGSPHGFDIIRSSE